MEKEDRLKVILGGRNQSYIGENPPVKAIEVAIALQAKPGAAHRGNGDRATVTLTSEGSRSGTDKSTSKLYKTAAEFKDLANSRREACSLQG